MKPRQAAALALVGWYLMLPPAARINGQWTALTQAPLSHWETLYSAGEVAGCQAFQRAAQVDWAKNWKEAEKLPPSAREAYQTYLRKFQAMWFASQCIASDDPRLAK